MSVDILGLKCKIFDTDSAVLYLKGNVSTQYSSLFIRVKTYRHVVIYVLGFTEYRFICL